MIACAVIVTVIWAYLLLARGRFWQSGPVLPDETLRAGEVVAIVVPARDEAEVIDNSLRSLLAQDYPAAFRVIMVDDNSTDHTGSIARAINDRRMTVVNGLPRPDGWSGKLWAVQQGIAEAGDAALILLTDADIVHGPSHLRSLVAHAQRNGLDLTSEMVTLACESWAERAFVPAFVFFFQLLYPFAWVNDRDKPTAAAAGGTILIRRSALERIGGIESVKGELIDDVALAAAVKKGGPIWLGHATDTKSVRRYHSPADIWDMITRTAYVQLRHSPLLLAATVIAMVIVWLLPPMLTLLGHGAVAWISLAAWLMLSASFLPTLRRFRQSLAWAGLLPLIALFYTIATIGSAINYHFGRGFAWKGRAYQGTAS